MFDTVPVLLATLRIPPGISVHIEGAGSYIVYSWTQSTYEGAPIYQVPVALQVRLWPRGFLACGAFYGSDCAIKFFGV